MPHSAKNPSAKVSLPSATYRALGKAFAECHVSTRQKKPMSTLTASLPSATLAALGKEFFLFFENSLPSAILLHSAKKFFLLKKNLCRVPWLWHSAKLGNWVSLPSAALGKAFTKCITRQSLYRLYFGLCLVPQALGKLPVSSSVCLL